MIGQRIGGFEVVAEIGRGGMGVVYRARQVSLDREVALKTLLPGLDLDETLVARFRAEALAASRVNHPNLVQVYDVGLEVENHYLAMELVEGESLGALIKRDGPLAYARAAAIASQIASGIGALHGAGIVHRDLKPSNILVRPDQVIKITDFGVARLQEGLSKLTADGHTVGTADYMSPEQAQGEELDGRSDIYSLGVVLYQMLTAQVPFSGTTPLAVMKQHCDNPPPSIRRKRSDVPDRLAQITDKCLAKSPEERYQTAEALSADLDHVRLELEFAALGADTPSQGTPSLYSTRAVMSLEREARGKQALPRRALGVVEKLASSAIGYVAGSLDRDVTALRRATAEMEETLEALAEAKKKRAGLRQRAGEWRGRADGVRQESAKAFDANDLGLVDELTEQEKTYNERAVDFETAAEGLSESIHELEERYKTACAEHERLSAKLELKRAQRVGDSLTKGGWRKYRRFLAYLVIIPVAALLLALVVFFLRPERKGPGVFPGPLPRRSLVTAPVPKPLPVPRSGIIYVNAEANGARDGTSWADALPSVQEALHMALNGAQIWVAEGTHKPTQGRTDRRGRDSSFQMKPGVALYGGFNGTETALDQRDWEGHVTVLSGDIGQEGAPDDNCYHVVRGATGATIDGFTITGGRGDGSGPDHRRRAGGLYNDGASPRVVNCTFRDNYALYGGAIQNRFGAEPVIENCLFERNSATHGGAIQNDACSSTITRCLFIGNLAQEQGGAMDNRAGASPTIYNCIFTANSAGDEGGAMMNSRAPKPTIVNCTFSGNTARRGGVLFNNEASPVLTNCILWGNQGTESGNNIFNYPRSYPKVTYSCVEGGHAGKGNISADPLFADPAQGDFHLKSEAGRYDSSLGLESGSGGAWVKDTVTSPCIAAGDLSSDYSKEPSPNGGRINMGAYGGTPGASLVALQASQANRSGASADKVIYETGFSERTRYEYSRSGNEADGIYGPTYRAAQTFTVGTVGPNETFTVKGVSLYLWKEGSPSTDLHVALYDVYENGFPETKLVESTAVVGSADWYEIPLPDYGLLAGETYAIVVWDGTGDASNRYRWGICNRDVYAGGLSYAYTSSVYEGWASYEGWRQDPVRDFKFEVYGVP